MEHQGGRGGARKASTRKENNVIIDDEHYVASSTQDFAKQFTARMKVSIERLNEWDLILGQKANRSSPNLNEATKLYRDMRLRYGLKYPRCKRKDHIDTFVEDFHKNQLEAAREVGEEGVLAASATATVFWMETRIGKANDVNTLNIPEHKRGVKTGPYGKRPNKIPNRPSFQNRIATYKTKIGKIIYCRAVKDGKKAILDDLENLRPNQVKNPMRRYRPTPASERRHNDEKLEMLATAAATTTTETPKTETPITETTTTEPAEEERPRKKAAAAATITETPITETTTEPDEEERPRKKAKKAHGRKKAVATAAAATTTIKTPITETTTEPAEEERPKKKAKTARSRKKVVATTASEGGLFPQPNHPQNTDVEVLEVVKPVPFVSPPPQKTDVEVLEVVKPVPFVSPLHSASSHSTTQPFKRGLQDPIGRSFTTEDVVAVWSPDHLVVDDDDHHGTGMACWEDKEPRTDAIGVRTEQQVAPIFATRESSYIPSTEDKLIDTNEQTTHSNNSSEYASEDDFWALLSATFRAGSALFLKSSLMLRYGGYFILVVGLVSMIVAILLNLRQEV